MGRSANTHGIWVPGLDDRPDFVCRVCQLHFPARQMHQFEHHVIRCAETHEERLMAASPSREPWNQDVDPEWEAYNRALRTAGIDPETQYKRQPR